MIVSVRKVSILFSNPILSWQSPGLCRLAKKKIEFSRNAGISRMFVITILTAELH